MIGIQLDLRHGDLWYLASVLSQSAFCIWRAFSGNICISKGALGCSCYHVTQIDAFLYKMDEKGVVEYLLAITTELALGGRPKPPIQYRSGRIDTMEVDAWRDSYPEGPDNSS